MSIIFYATAFSRFTSEKKSIICITQHIISLLILITTISRILGRGYVTRSQRILIIIRAIVMIYLILWNVHILYKLHILLYTYTLADTHMSNTYASLQLTNIWYIYIYMTINDNDRRHTSILWVVTLLRCVCTKKFYFLIFFYILTLIMWSLKFFNTRSNSDKDAKEPSEISIREYFYFCEKIISVERNF